MRAAASNEHDPRHGRRTAVAAAIALLCGSFGATARARRDGPPPERRWYEAAEAMKQLAQSWGDQPYGAVLVLDGELIGAGPSRVVKDRNPDAHAEREALRDARQRLGRAVFPGAILYATSRPCGLCEAAAARAGVGRMYHGPKLTDAGSPRAAAP